MIFKRGIMNNSVKWNGLKCWKFNLRCKKCIAGDTEMQNYHFTLSVPWQSPLICQQWNVQKRSLICKRCVVVLSVIACGPSMRNICVSLLPALNTCAGRWASLLESSPDLIFPPLHPRCEQAWKNLGLFGTRMQHVGRRYVRKTEWTVEGKKGLNKWGEKKEDNKCVIKNRWRKRHGRKDVGVKKNRVMDRIQRKQCACMCVCEAESIWTNQ